MLNKKATLLLFSFFTSSFLSSCSSLDYDGDLKTVQQRDKNLTCKQLLLEINEAKFSSEMNYSKKTAKAFKDRSNYLDSIYTTINCNGLEDYVPKGQVNASISPYMYYSAPLPASYYSLPVYSNNSGYNGGSGKNKIKDEISLNDLSVSKENLAFLPSNANNPNLYNFKG